MGYNMASKCQISHHRLDTKGNWLNNPNHWAVTFILFLISHILCIWFTIKHADASLTEKPRTLVVTPVAFPYAWQQNKTVIYAMVRHSLFLL